VLGLVGQQRFDDRQQGRGVRALRSFSSSEMPMRSSSVRHQVRLAIDLQALDFLRRHEFAALVATGDEGKVVVDLLPLGSQAARADSFARSRRGNRLQAAYFGVALEHFEAHPHFVDAVMNSFQLGRLVHHVLGRRHLAAVVQPGRDVHRFPVVARSA
jgi:hypothetical protein